MVKKLLPSVEIFDLDIDIKETFFDIHGTNRIIVGDNPRVLFGWYEKNSIRVRFYYKPSWVARQRMYWFHGWKWVDIDDKTKVI